jgi:hypothetical protein
MRFGISRKRLRLLSEFTKQSLHKKIIMIKYTNKASVIIEKLQWMLQVPTILFSLFLYHIDST